MKSGAVAELLLWIAAATLFAFGADLRPHTESEYEPTKREPDVLRLVTWNVGGTEDGKPHSLRAEHVPAIADALAKLDADVVFLQEVPDTPLLRTLASALGSEWQAWRGRGDCGVLTRRPNVERWGPRRVQNQAGVRFEHEGRSLVVLSIHAAAFSAKERNETIGEALEALLDEPADARALVGDLNLNVDRDQKSELFSDDLHADVESYNALAQHFTDAALGRGPTAEPDRRLDYAFLSPELEPITATPWHHRRTGTMDHHPLVIDLRLRH